MSTRTLGPSRTLTDAPLGQGGQIQAIAAAPRAGRIAVLGNHQAISVVDLAAGRITATLPCASAARFVAFDGDDHVLALDTRGLVRLAMDGTSQVLVAHVWAWPDEWRVSDVLARGDTAVLLEQREHGPQQACRARVFHGGTAAAEIDYTLAEVAGMLALAGERRSLIVHAAALAPDGGRIVALASVMQADGEGTTGVVLIHDLDGHLLRAHAVPRAAVFLGNETAYFPGRLAFAPDGQRFATAHGGVRVFDAGTGALVHDMALHVGGAPAQARQVAILAGGDLVVACERCVGRWSPGASEATVSTAYREHAFVLAMTATPTTVAIGDDRALLLFSLPDLAPLHQAPGNVKSVSQLAVDRTGACVASSDGASLVIWDVAAGAPRFRIPARCWTGLVFSPDGEELMAPLDGMRPHVLDAHTGEIRVVGESAALAIQWADRPRCLHYDEVADDDEVAAQIIVSEGREARATARLPAPYLRCVPALSRDGRRALVWSDMQAYGWDLASGVQLWARPIDLVQAALSPDGAFALVTRIGGPPAVIDMATGETRVEVTEIGWSISWAVAWSAQRDRLAVGSDSEPYLIELVDADAPEAGMHVTLLRSEHKPGVTALAFSGDATVLITGGGEGAIRLFDLGATRAVVVPPAPVSRRGHLPGAPCRLLHGELAGLRASVVDVAPDGCTVRVEVETGTGELVEVEVDVDMLE